MFSCLILIVNLFFLNNAQKIDVMDTTKDYITSSTNSSHTNRALLLPLLNKKPTLKLVVVCWKRKGRTLETWFKTAMATGCDVDYICFQELEYADERKDVDFVLKYLAPGSLFIGMVDSAEPFCCGIAKILLDLCVKYNVSSNSLYFGHTGDESRPPFPYLKDFYLKFKKVYRNFWWNVEPFISLRKEKRLEWFPMGPLTRGNMTFDMIPSSQRQQKLYFSGGRITNTRRPGQLGFLGRTLNVTVGGRIGGSKSYVEDLRNSIFCVNIRGTSAECYRFYESIEAGCIPLMMNQYHDFNYQDQHEHQYSLLMEVPWEKHPVGKYPFLWVEDANELSNLYNSLLHSDEIGLRRLDEMQSNLVRWYEAMKLHYNQMFSSEVCPVHTARP